MYAQDSAAVRSPAGISEIFECLMGVKQGCPLSATLFGLYIDGLEQHLKDTVGHCTLTIRHADSIAVVR